MLKPFKPLSAGRVFHYVWTLRVPNKGAWVAKLLGSLHGIQDYIKRSNSHVQYRVHQKKSDRNKKTNVKKIFCSLRTGRFFLRHC